MRLCTTPRPKGQGLVEYALILVLIAIAVILVVTMLGGQIRQTFALLVLQLQYPGNYSGDAVTPGNLVASAQKYGAFGNETVKASLSLDLGIAAGSRYCVQFTHSGGGNSLVCGTNPEANFTPSAGGGSVTACLVAIEGYSAVGGPHCAEDTY
jgi:pilus assembly protein Flp/PilA